MARMSFARRHAAAHARPDLAIIELSAIGRWPGSWTTATWSVVAVHPVGVGSPIALAARRWVTPQA
jgi:hypothetical protein